MIGRRMRLGRRAITVAATAICVLVIAAGLTLRLTRHGEVRERSPAGSTSPPPEPTSRLQVPTLRFQGSGLEGGGFENVVAVDPSGSGVVLSGGDVSGFQRSTDWGATWETTNRGITTQSELRVATIVFSETTPGKVYAGVGWKGRLGGLLVSTDGGRSWALLSDVPGFSGIGHPSVPGLERPFPRSTGNLLALDEKDGLIYAATFNKGVVRSSDDGKTWTSLGLEGKFLRSIVLDPSHSDVLYVAALGDGVYKTNTARTSGTFTRLAQAPATPVQLALIDGDLYLAAGKQGVWRSSDSGASFTRLNLGSVPSNGPFWRSIAGYRGCGDLHLLIGSGSGFGEAGGGKYSVMHSADGGNSWSAVVDDPSNLSTQVGGSSKDRWWLARRGEFMLGGRAYAAASIAIAMPRDGTGSCANPRIFVAGRSGVWQSTDGGTKWFPAVGRMAVTVAVGVAADPSAPGSVYVAVKDWTVLESRDGGQTFVNNRPGGGGEVYSIGLNAGISPARVYLGTKGGIFSSSDPASGSPWTSEGLGPASGGGVPSAIVAQQLDSSPVVLAAVGKSGIWRKTSDTWTRVNNQVMAGTRGASFAWPARTSTVYFYDPGTGVWRSDDAGERWTQIWSVGHGDAHQPGYLAVDPLDASRLYLSLEHNGVYRFDNASAASYMDRMPVKLGSFAGPIAVDLRGGVFLTQAGMAKHPPTLFYSGDLGSTWHDLATDAYRAAAYAPAGLAVGPEGRIYVALKGNGLLLGTVVKPTPVASASAP